MTKNIIGTFVFRNDGDGCLSSKYYHGNQLYPFVEASKRLDKSKAKKDGFDGEYKTIWIQDSQRHFDAILRIIWNQQSNTYKLTWTMNGEIEFEGIGMIYDKLLVGAYWDA